MILRAKNWGEFQHYKDRSPSWIKLHRKLLDDRAFHRLPDASRALAPMLWLLASESDDGSIVDAVAEISFRLRMTEKKAEEAVNPLIEAGFFSVEQSASAPLANPEQTAPLEEKRREQEKEETEAFEDFCISAKKHGWPVPAKLNDDRRRKLRLRLEEHGLDGWRSMLAAAEASKWLRVTFKLKLDWVLEPKNFTKVIEGNYAADSSPESRPTFAQQREQAATTVIDHDGLSQWRARVKDWQPGAFWLEHDWGPEPFQPGCRVPAVILAEIRQ